MARQDKSWQVGCGFLEQVNALKQHLYIRISKCIIATFVHQSVPSQERPSMWIIKGSSCHS